MSRPAADERTTDGTAGGPYTQEAQHLLADILPGSTALLTTSCTDALEMAAILTDLEPGDEVIVPSFGFVTTALAFVRSGARIRFADIEEPTLGLDPSAVDAATNTRTRAIVPIHYAGIPAPITDLRSVAAKTGAVLIEDAAHALGGSIGDKPLGTFAPLAALSFHATKNFSCGEGGALVVNDESLLERAHVVLDKGTDRRAFVEGTVDRYTWHDLGSSFGMSDFLAARLVAELQRAAAIQSARRAIHETYQNVLEPLATELGFVTPAVPIGVVPAYHLYYVILDDATVRDPLLAGLQAGGVKASFHFVPLHRTPGGERWGYPADCPVTDRVAASLIRLPLHQSMSTSDAERNAHLLIDGLRGFGR